jgi:hypothetical protein
MHRILQARLIFSPLWGFCGILAQDGYMYLFFGDERKSKNSFSLILYGVKSEDLVIITDKIREFKVLHNLSYTYEFHFYQDSNQLNQDFISFIKSLNISHIYKTKNELLSEPTSHIIALNHLIPQIATDFQSDNIRFIFDKLGGKKTEAILKTEINRICRQHSLKQSRNVKFVDSKNSSFIQIADYLVAVIDKGLI